MDVVTSALASSAAVSRAEALSRLAARMAGRPGSEKLAAAVSDAATQASEAIRRATSELGTALDLTA